MDDEVLVYPFYERLVKAGIKNVCVHEGLFPPSVAEKYPHLPHCDVRDVGRAAKDSPQLDFVICHSACRHGGASRAPDAWAEFQRTGRVAWVNDLAEIPEDLQRAHGFAPLGPADGPVKRGIFAGNSRRMYGIGDAALAALAGDGVAAARAAWRESGEGRSNLAYGYVLDMAGG